MRLLKAREMKRVEEHASKYGLSYQRMMENAGAACARNIRSILEKQRPSARNIAVVCGKGNNGGDGFVIARKLFESGYRAAVILAGGYPATPQSETAFGQIAELSVPCVWYTTDRAKALQTIKNADCVVDALFGFSFYGEISRELLPLFQEMNDSAALKVAVDVPSGVYCDSGLCDPACFSADYTIAISALKPAHILHPASDHCGDIIVASIGIPTESFDAVGHSIYTYNAAQAAALLPRRAVTANKGDFGHLLSLCGSRRMPGAAFLAAKAALRCGTGLVTAAFPKSIYQTMALKLTEALLLPLEETPQGALSAACIPTLLKYLDRFSCILIGCGLTVSEDTTEVLRAVLEHAKVPVIVDADGINILAQNIDILQNAASPVVLTPHPKEMSRLLSCTVGDVQADRAGNAADFAERQGVHLVLKGSNTVVASPDDSRIYLNATGNNGLSKGGSGDVLAGMIGALAAQGVKLPQAANLGVYLHGYAADLAAKRLSRTGMLPTDLIEELATAFAAFEN